MRFRLAASLPWPASETIVEFLPVARGRVVGAAVRRSTVAEYEEAAVATGLEIERVHLAPLLALEGLVRSGAREAVHAVMGDVALCLATFHEGALVALRNRRRDRSSGEGSRLREELVRAAALAGNGTGPARLVVSGADAARLRREVGAEPSAARARGPRGVGRRGRGRVARGAAFVSRQPDFSTAPRPSRVPAFETVAVAVGLVALVLAGGAAWRARDEARVARARLDDVRREVEAASARLRALDASARSGRPELAAVDAEPARIVADVAAVLPGDARLERLSIDYARGGAVELQVVARDASAWDRLLARLEKAPQFREVEPGPEVRDAEVRSLVRVRWVGGPR